MSNCTHFLPIQICNPKIDILYQPQLEIEPNEMTFYNNNPLLQLQVQELKCEIHLLLLSCEEFHEGPQILGLERQTGLDLEICIKVPCK